MHGYNNYRINIFLVKMIYKHVLWMCTVKLFSK